MTYTSSLDKSLLHPGLVSVMDRAHEILADEGTPFKTYSGLRTFAEQDELYAKGRDSSGKAINKDEIVTKARGGQSTHNFGLAVDSAPLVDPDNPKGEVEWPDKDSPIWLEYERAVYEASQEVEYVGVDIEWGGRWRFKDVPHVQVRTTYAELQGGYFPYCHDVEWAVKAHTTFLFDTPWIINRIQYLLAMQSYQPGAIDGIFGTRTEEAFLQFAKDQDVFSDRKDVIERLVLLHHKAASFDRGTKPEDVL